MISPVKIWRNQKKIEALLGKVGEIVSWTKVYVPPAGFISQAPYIVAVVKLKEGKNIICQYVDWGERELVIGQKVKTILRRTQESDTDGVIPYGVKVKPVN
ncbi:hypothetical protein A3D77_01600 [Candidatus Gottesmanbacteria bacterium RIFCSPHIGHO2_02_FULL_39_11]|uniref:ChsH2 C-terminal OB-fold domain-containing protein n=1 Tax=Candidatus Gottesmanbacteria bacterium RIFCSPHIGHO2_02_FULL_39_11 TaxID=1798382 RepID=A0A1F5ZTL0_9BACT|nr:MAG: hypothetical protein A3D77_01600 [Candidatus Gottesmanbacteria bacterium RIFCSPHIGHO2_02_FULL_39_11]